MRGAVRHAVIKTIADSKNGYALNVEDTGGQCDSDGMDFPEKEEIVQEKMKRKVDHLLKKDRFTKRKDTSVRT